MIILGLQGSFGLFIKPLTEEMGWNRTEISGAYSLAQIVYGIFGIIIGILSDRFGPRVAILICGVSAGLGTLLMSQVNSIWQIYLFYGVLFGIGNAIFVPLLSTIARWFVKRRAMMSAIAFTGSGFGMLGMPLIVNMFITSYDWRLSFVFSGIGVLIISTIAAIFFRSTPSKMGQTAYGEELEPKPEARPARSGYTFKQAFRTGAFWSMSIALLSYGFAFVALQVHIVPYASDTGISDTSAALILTIMGGAVIGGQIGLGPLADKFGYKKGYLIGLTFVLIAIIFILLSKDLWAFYACAVFLGIGFGATGAVCSPMVALLFGLSSHGTILGFFSFCFTIGGALGPIIFGYIYDSTLSYSTALWASGGLALLAVIAMALLRNPRSLAQKTH